jgi:uncharacterized protein
VKRVFADTSYWVALVNPRDPLREKALAANRELTGCLVVTTQEVLTELAGFFSAFGTPTRERVGGFLGRLLAGGEAGEVEVIPQSDVTFREGLELYLQRSDKEYSLVDCISMEAMRARGLIEVLTHDHHFEQEGFRALLRD